MESRSSTEASAEMERRVLGRRFSVEAKNFFFAVREDLAEVCLEERRKGFVGCVSLGVQGSIWLVDSVEEALKSPGIDDFVKSFRQAEKTIMVRGGGNKAGHFLKILVFSEGVRNSSIWIPEGRGGWGWRRFVGELRQMILDAKVGKQISEVPFFEGKQKGVSGRSYADVLRSVEKEGLKGPQPECSGLQATSSVSAKQSTDTKGKFDSFSVNLFLGFSSVLLNRVRGILGRVLGKGPKPNGFWSKLSTKKPIIPLYPFWKSSGQSVKLCFRSSPRSKGPGPHFSVPAKSLDVPAVLSSSDILKKVGLGSVLMEESELKLLEVGPERFSKDHQLGNVVPVFSARDDLIPVSYGPSHSVLSSSGVWYSSVQPPASSTFGFPLSLAPDLCFSAAPAPSLAPGFSFTPLRPLEFPQSCFDPPSLAGAAVLGEKLCSSLPVVASKLFLSYFRRAKALRVKYSVKWTDELVSNSMEAAKMSCTVKIFTVAAPPAKKVVELPTTKRTETPVKPGLFRKGFFNLPPIVSVPSASAPSCRHFDPVSDAGAGPTEILQETSSEISLGSESGVALVGVDPLDVDGESGSLPPALETSVSLSSAEVEEKLISEWEMDVRKKVVGFWENVSQECAGNVSEEHEERFRAISDEMIKYHKTKGRNELLILQSSVDCGDSKISSRCRKGKNHVL